MQVWEAGGIKDWFFNVLSFSCLFGIFTDILRQVGLYNTHTHIHTRVCAHAYTHTYGYGVNREVCLGIEI